MTDGVDLKELSRKDLDALATEAGVPEPDKLPNREAVAVAIEAARQVDPQIQAEAAGASAGQPPADTPDDDQTPKAVVTSAHQSTRGKSDLEPVSRLIEQSQDFFGVGSHVAAGAFHHVEADELSREQGQAIIDAWKTAAVS